MLYLRRALSCALVSLAVIGGLASASPSPASAATNTGATAGDDVGFADGNLLWLPADRQARTLDAIAATGARWLRVDFPWSVVQADGPDSWAWGPIDRFVYAARLRDLDVLPIIGHSPAWARPSGTSPTRAPSDLSAFARYAGAVARRYAPLGIHAFEIWNEPNLRGFWGTAPDPVRYTTMLTKASAAIHAADPAATVVSGGLAPATDVAGESIAPLTFLAQIYANDGGDAFDAVGMHPYSWPYPALHPEPWNTFWIQPYAYWLMTLMGDADKQIWGTEIGYPTGTFANAVSESEQATLLPDAIRAWEAYSFSGPAFVYAWRDRGTNLADPFQNMGVRRFDGTAKPVLPVLTRLFLEPR